MQKPDKSKWLTCLYCDDNIPPGLKLYKICSKCLIKQVKR